MEFRKKMAMITLYAKQQKRHRCICGHRGGGVHSEMGTDTWALPCVKQTVGPYYIVQGAQPGALC